MSTKERLTPAPPKSLLPILAILPAVFANLTILLEAEGGNNLEFDLNELLNSLAASLIFVFVEIFVPQRAIFYFFIVLYLCHRVSPYSF
jgi:hypothetical protein